MIVHVAAQRMARIIVLVVLLAPQRRLPHAARIPQAGPKPGARQILEIEHGLGGGRSSYDSRQQAANHCGGAKKARYGV